MDFLEGLLGKIDILDLVVYEWLGTKDLVQLDNAVIGAQRRDNFLTSLSTIRYRVPFEHNLELWWRHHKQIIEYFVSREMYKSEGVWHVNQKLWESLQNDPTDKYHTFIASFRGLRFENFIGSCNLKGLEKCQQLTELEICNLLTPAHNPNPFHLPKLRRLYVQNCTINNEFLQYFQNCPVLKQVHFHHVKFVEVSASHARDFLRQVESIKVLGDVDGFIKHLCQSPNQLVVAKLDKMHKAENRATDLHDFLQRSPQLRELHVERMRLHDTSLFKCLKEYNRYISLLHLNHIRFMDTATTVPANNNSNGLELTFSTLKLSTPLPSTDDQVLHLLEACKSNVTHLELSFCSKLTDNGLHQMLNIARLQSIQIDDKKELWQGGDYAGRVDRIAQTFQSVPKVRISVWPEWKSEFEKEKYNGARENLFVKGL